MIPGGTHGHMHAVLDGLTPHNAVHVAREVLADFDAGGTEEHPVSEVEAAYWLGRVAEALRLVLGAVIP